MPALTDLRFRWHGLRRDLSNFALIRHRDYAGFLVSMHQSGTHWLKHMLATAIARRYGLPPPAYAHANDIIGGTDDPRPEGAPALVFRHSIPHPLVASPWFRKLVRFPPYLVLVRDIRATLVANYEKWKEHYQCSFGEYLRGDVRGRRFNSDIWWCIRFCNAWHRIARRFPGDTLVIRYEDLQRDTMDALRRADAFLQLGLDEADLAAAVAESSKEKMAAKASPDLPEGVRVVRKDARPFSRWFSEADREFLTAVCRRHLRGDFGYDYNQWPPD